MKTKTDSYTDKLTVLVIEDNLGDYVLVEDYLLEKFSNIDINHYPDYESATTYLNTTKDEVSVILLDLNLPEIRGMELINSILKCNYEIPVIILTGYSDLDMAKKSLQIGIYDYLVKDEINPVILRKTITFAINRSSFIKEIETEKQNYENLFNFNPQPTWLLDANSLEIINANIAAQFKYGYSLNEFRQMTFAQLHPVKEQQMIRNNLISDQEEAIKEHFTHIIKDGSTIKADVYFKKISNDANNSIIVQSNDVTETLNHINTIEIQNTKLKNIAWTQSHVVRAPISRILGIINLMEGQVYNEEEIVFWMKQLKISTMEMDDIVKKIVSESNQLENE
ncbi:response regulator [Flavobacterium sp.]|uniref:response regulator n=1 Tax=Flavobacterium sp. TaxID=239 RepID=UPI00261076A8|nr:response regulator [Flavobacterium sp.]MDG2433404.1 response regulator [Flavobacterium sp.]